MNNEDDLETAYDLASSALCQKALDAYKNDAVGWRGTFMLPLTWVAANAISGKSSELNVAFGRMLLEVAAMLGDAGRGARHPLGAVRKVANRPPLNSIKSTVQMWMATIAGSEISKGNLEKRPLEESYRAASRRIREQGANVSWKELRSAWVNRKRTGIESEISDAMAVAVKANYSDRVLNGLASIAAEHINRKAPSYD